MHAVVSNCAVVMGQAGSMSELQGHVRIRQCHRERLGANAGMFAEEHFWTWEERIGAEVQEVTQLVERGGSR